jgi:predicted RNA-binding Zn-ribbon protein involved in translation (DUF1610 family)
MPYDAYGNYVQSKANKTTDVLGYDAIGGVGQLIYHLVRFKEYELDYTSSDVLIARPYCQKGYEPELYTTDSPTGAELTASIYNLAKKIDDPSEERPYTDLIIEWCKKYGHPYAIDSIHAYMMEPQYKLEEDGYFIEKDATFSIDDFMRDLEWFYQAMRMHFAFEQIYRGDDESALALHEDGRYFSGLPFFEQYRRDPEADDPELYYLSAEGDFLKMMQMDSEAALDLEYSDGFARSPIDYYEEVQSKLLDMIPDFRVRLKINPKTRKVVFAADVHSVFDICWYTLARKLSEDVAPEDKGTSADHKEKTEGVIMSCPFCGEAFVRRSNRSVICGKPECHNARKAMNKRNSRRKAKNNAQQNK